MINYFSFGILSYKLKFDSENDSLNVPNTIKESKYAQKKPSIIFIPISV